MLPSLGIRNYRNLKSLDIDRLARVNLIAGKNNTGKTSLLEAVSLYAAGGDVQWINTLLKARGEYQQTLVSSDKKNNLSDLLRNNIKSYRAIFYQREVDDQIEVGSLSKNSTQKLTIVISQSEYPNETGSVNPEIILRINNRNETVTSSLDKDLSSGIWNWDRLTTYEVKKKSESFTSNFQFVGTKGNMVYEDAVLWDKIVLKEEEVQVTEALKVIDGSIVRIAFINTEVEGIRKPVVKMSSYEETIPLQSMGDGMNRMFSIVLAIVNAKNGYLLIDEFENGLHYTVQEDLWKMIFKLAKELNVQVFATTHSDDCIHAFKQVFNGEGNEEEGQYFRLEKFGEIIKPIFYSASELEIAVEHNIETR